VGSDAVLETIIGGSYSGQQIITALSATSAVAVYSEEGSGRPRAVAMSISGATITPGTAIELNATIVNFYRDTCVLPYGSGNVLAVWSNLTYLQAATVAISGTTLTANGDITNVDTGGVLMGLNTLSAKKLVVTYSVATDVARVYGAVLGPVFTHSTGGIPGLILVA
jgi:hypothetical protein